jgi:hypothetical protein
MRIAKQAALIAAISLTVIASAATAATEEDATSCRQAGRQVYTALKDDQSANAEAARKEANVALEFCHSGFYQQGVAHYAKALELLTAKS